MVKASIALLPTLLVVRVTFALFDANLVPVIFIGLTYFLSKLNCYIAFTFIATLHAFFIIVCTSAFVEALVTIYLDLIFSVISFVNIISLVGIVATFSAA